MGIIDINKKRKEKDEEEQRLLDLSAEDFNETIEILKAYEPLSDDDKDFVVALAMMRGKYISKGEEVPDWLIEAEAEFRREGIIKDIDKAGS